MQIYKPKKKGYGYEQQFLRAYSVEEIQKLKSRAWIDRYFDKDIERVEYGSYYMTDELIGSCNIYLNREAGSTNENELTVFFKKLDPDAYVNLRIWYGDPKDDAGEFFLIGLS